MKRPVRFSHFHSGPFVTITAELEIASGYTLKYSQSIDIVALDKHGDQAWWFLLHHYRRLRHFIREAEKNYVR